MCENFYQILTYFCKRTIKNLYLNKNKMIKIKIFADCSFFNKLSIFFKLFCFDKGIIARFLKFYFKKNNQFKIKIS